MTRKSNKAFFQPKNDKKVKTNTTNSSSTHQSICNMRIITIISSILVILVSIIVGYSKLTTISFANTININEGGWINDKLFEIESLDVGCDIPILEYSEINWNKLNKEDLMSTPFIIKGR